MADLAVLKENRLVGRILDLAEGPMFLYSEEWLLSADAEALSPRLPLRLEPFPEKDCRAFFENLLSEGSSRDILEKVFHISGMTTVLRRFGRDLAGEYSVEEVPDPQSDPPSYVLLPEARLRTLLKEGIQTVVEHYPGYRISLPGVQQKLVCFKRASGTALFIPINGAPSTHILKPDIFGVRSVTRSALNEAFIMTLARTAGLTVADVEYRPELSSVLVTRFDRETSGEKVFKIPQIDTCQILGIPPDKKYESDGGPSLADILNVVREYAERPAVATLSIVRGYIFSALCGNMDHHAKNISLFWKKGRLSPAPLYDLVNTFVYEKTDRNLAFKVGGERRPGVLSKVHWDRFATEIGFRKDHLSRIVLGFAAQVESTIEETRRIDAFQNISPQEKVFLERISRDIVSRARKWTKQIERAREGGESSRQ